MTRRYSYGGKNKDGLFTFTAKNHAQAKVILERYPKDHAQSAVLPLLDLAQRQNGGFLSHASLEHVAEFLKMPLVRVMEVASFYAMFSTKPRGKYHIKVCDTPPCWFVGGPSLLKICRQWLGIDAGEVTADGKFSLESVTCLGACKGGPVLQVNDDTYESLDDETLRKLLDSLAEDMPLPSDFAVKKKTESGGQDEA